MAIISIPSSIGGVTIPGSVTNGPLGMLFGKRGSNDSLQYPRDLGSATRGHSVRFEIFEIEPIGYQEGKETSFTSIGSGIVESGKKVYNTAIELAKNGNTNGMKPQDKVNISLNPNMSKKAVATIDLYMPETMAFQYQSSYNDISLKEAIQGAATELTKGLKVTSSIVQGVNSVIDSDIAKLTLKSQGLAINPMQQMVFQGIDFREYQLAFTFTPYSKQEAQTVEKIIKKFKAHAAPRITTGAAGMFFIPPSTFKIKFLFKGKENPNVNKVEDSVITSIDVNYAPNGWSTHSDGAPVQTTLTMNLKETVLIDRAKIEAGY
jgi:hypothetical protein